LLQAGDELLRAGRLEMMRRWIDLLPSDLLEQYPKLLYWRGEVARLSSRFTEAVHWYTLAEGAYIQRGDNLGRSLVYRGQAQVYLDTIQPSKAVQWLQKAVQILGDDHPQETSQILRLLAENHTNSGNLQEAIALVARANQLIAATPCDELDIRIRLRTGRLTQAKRLTREIIDRELADSDPTHRIPRSHREMHLLLALIDAFLGETASSDYHARQGITTGQTLRSPFVEAVGYMRLGHARFLADHLEEAQEYYRRSIQMSEGLQVERGKVEALMGMCLTSGLRGELEQADRYGRMGLELALNVHDLWCANMVRLACGAIWTMWGQDEEALPWLLEAADGFLVCGDAFLSANVQLWLSLLYHRQGRREEFARTVRDLLAAVETNGYEDLFRKRTLFGPRDLQVTVPFLIAARDELGLEGAERMLRHLGCKGLTKHPGYTLRICALGDFTVYRGVEEIERKEWKREKSRQLFQLLLTRQGQLVQRDEIYDLLWPDGDEKTASRDFKVAMNALANALEPHREARADSFFIERVDSAYRLLQHPAVHIDAHEFRDLAEKGLVKEREPEQATLDLEAALHLYQGDFLQHQPYLDWCLDERERLHTLYLRVRERLAELHLAAGRLQEAILCGEQLLTADPCWEAGYRLLMTAYHQLGNRSLVIATYQKCVNQLQEQLALAPMEATTKLYQRYVRRSQAATSV
ncbi:MAG TPA: BTAD domain-containing putative transcriptional regulator, partial [Bacilli bacterium]|nr:BTAD domain-containing putative transcriptional regulator [Bacilli bacterium]